jgi:para-aminobenzoate synthetase/4-amino-4-deoxychorismate lyase
MIHAIIHGDAKDADKSWLWFDDLAGVVEARRVEEIIPALEAVDRATQRGLFAAGYVAYEAAGAFEPRMAAHPPAGRLAWFGLFRTMRNVPEEELPDAGGYSLGDWRPTIDENEHRRVVDKIREYIAAGDTYQVNFTFRLRASFCGDAWGLFRKFCRVQPSEFAGYLDDGERKICSASPELFFDLRGDALVCRPMKGTARRGVDSATDERLARMLAKSSKNRAENAMIVDMIRNDAGRVARAGGVCVASAFDVERYPTLHQMTSTVKARTKSPLPEIMRAMFPCASITGAPKIRTAQIIRELESTPRGVYTGAVGYVLPGRIARFSVGIRTAVVDASAASAEYGVGGGIVWDSLPANEYRECLLKAEILSADAEEFELLESILYEGAGRYFLLEEHLRRIESSARYFGFAVDIAAVRARLSELAAALPNVQHKVRLLVGRTGAMRTEAAQVPVARQDRPWRLRVAKKPVSSRDVFLYHKTTRRSVYDAAMSSRGDGDDVLLFNQHGQVTETCIANIVVEIGGRRYTPPVRCGLLAGTFREELLREGKIETRVITLEQLRKADAVYAVNSVRRWMPAKVEW